MARWFARISLWTEYLSCCILFYLLASISMDYEHVYTLSRLSRCNIRSEHKFRGISDTWIHLEYLISITFISDFNVVVSNIHFIWFSCFYFVFFSLLTWKNKSARNSCLQWNSLLISFYSFIRGALFCRFINKRSKPYLLHRFATQAFGDCLRPAFLRGVCGNCKNRTMTTFAYIYTCIHYNTGNWSN